jgi:predicted kinase
MDLDARGRPDLGYYFTEQYSAHARDPQLFSLLPFYRCYRAYVRGKVLSFRLDEPEFSAEEKEEAAARARQYFELARRYASPLQYPTVIAVAGLSGSGKTTLSRAIAAELGLRVVSSDAVRSAIFTGCKRASNYGADSYSAGSDRTTYRALLEKGQARLQESGGVVLDATFRRAADRVAAQKMASAAGAAWRLIECRLAPDQVSARLARRAACPYGLSDATWETYLRQRKEFDSLDAARDGAFLTLDTSSSLATNSRTATDWLRCNDRET